MSRCNTSKSMSMISKLSAIHEQSASQQYPSGLLRLELSISIATHHCLMSDHNGMQEEQTNNILPLPDRSIQKERRIERQKIASKAARTFTDERCGERSYVIICVCSLLAAVSAVSVKTERSIFTKT